MIVSLHLKNFTIISSLDLTFANGMSVFTGETGAGKSIIIDAIQLVLGARLDKQVVREGCEKSEISIVFDVKNNLAAKAWLEQHDLTNDDDCILRRNLYQEGRSRSFINGQPSTLSNLSELGQLLIDIHGQHQNQNLMNTQQQLALLDRYGNHDKYLNQLQKIVTDWQVVKSEITLLNEQVQNRQQQQAFLQFQLDEFTNLNLQMDELEQLNQEHKQLSNAENLMAQTEQLRHILFDSDTALTNQFSKSLAILDESKLYSEDLQNAHQLLSEADVLLAESVQSIRQYQDKLEVNPQRLMEIDNRLGAIHDLARKHRVTPDKLTEIATNLSEELNNLDNSEERLHELNQQRQTIENNYEKLAKKLTASRTKTAKELNQLINKDLQELNMKGCQFEILCKTRKDDNPHPLGNDQIEFLAATNTGQKLQAITKIASGGELSRIGLAIQVNIAKKMQIPALIFDEVDAGIGGATANIVGGLLKKLSKNTQIFCITHLPQIAAKAQHHFLVQKYSKNKHTITEVKILPQEDIVAEISRMLSGKTDNPTSLAHARLLLDEA